MIKPFITSLFLLSFSFATAGDVVERVIAIVNDDIILKTDVDRFAQRLKTGAIVDDLLSEDSQGLLKDRKALIRHMVDEKVIDSEVKKKGLTVTIEQVEKEISKITSRNGINRTQLKEALKSQGTSFSEYQEFLKKRLERQSIIEQSVTSKIKISDEEISAYYLTHRSGGATAKDSFEYKVSHILFMNDGGSFKNAERKAKQVLERIRSGESFETLASKYSEDPNFSSGGLLGTFKTGEFLKELESAAAKVEVGQVTGLVYTKTGIHILKLLDRRLIADPKLEGEKERIRQVLYQAAFKKQFSFWLDQKRRESFIRVNEPGIAMNSK
ncbi:MAG: peptidylprolyl isomerase [Bdellovibrionales bacterium]